MWSGALRWKRNFNWLANGTCRVVAAAAAAVDKWLSFLFTKKSGKIKFKIASFTSFISKFNDVIVQKVSKSSSLAMKRLINLLIFDFHKFMKKRK